MPDTNRSERGPYLAGLTIYPVKAASGIPIERAQLGPLGLEHDRRWMIVDASTGQFLTQRRLPMLATLRTAIAADHLALELPDGSAFQLPLDDRGGRRRVRVWADDVEAVMPDPAADRALSRWLGQEVTIVRLPSDAERLCDPGFAPAGSQVAFADGFPLLVTTTGSLAALNTVIERRGGSALPMSRFRPNIVVAEPQAGREDWAKRLVIAGAVELLLVKRCERCAVTTVDQTTGERRGKEPLASLAISRTDKRSGGVWFGQNAVPLPAPCSSEELEVGQRIEWHE